MVRVWGAWTPSPTLATPTHTAGDLPPGVLIRGKTAASRHVSRRQTATRRAGQTNQKIRRSRPPTKTPRVFQRGSESASPALALRFFPSSLLVGHPPSCCRAGAEAATRAPPPVGEAKTDQTAAATRTMGTAMRRPSGTSTGGSPSSTTFGPSRSETPRSSGTSSPPRRQAKTMKFSGAWNDILRTA